MFAHKNIDLPDTILHPYTKIRGETILCDSVAGLNPQTEPPLPLFNRYNFLRLQTFNVNRVKFWAKSA